MEIRSIPDDGQVTEPGAYRMSMRLYHSQAVCPGPSFSSTGIRTAELKSPLAFWKTTDLNPKRYPPREEGDALILGKAAHCLILGDEVFADNFAYVPEDAPDRPSVTQIETYRTGAYSDRAKFFVRPSDAPRLPNDAQIVSFKAGTSSVAATASCEFWLPIMEAGRRIVSASDMEAIEKNSERVEYWDAFMKKAAGRSLLTAEQVTRIGYMAENLAELPEAREALIGELTEISMIWQDEITGLWVKSRPDCIPSNGVDFGDLKTFSPKGSDLILSAQRAITDHGYAVQMAMAVEGAERVFGYTASRCALIFTQTTEPYEPVPIMLDEESLHWGRVLFRSGLDKIARGLETGEWPPRARGFVNYAFPPTMLHRFGEMQLAGELPIIERNAA